MKAIPIITVLVLAGCSGLALEDTMRRCESNPRFEDFVSCTKDLYAREGRFPNRAELPTLYREFDAIAERKNEGKIGEAQAKAEAFAVYRRIVLREGAPQTKVVIIQ